MNQTAPRDQVLPEQHLAHNFCLLFETLTRVKKAQDPTTAAARRKRDFDKTQEKLKLASLTNRMDILAAAAFIGCSPSLLRKVILQGDGPAHYLINSRRVFRLEDLEAWVNARRVTPTPGPYALTR